MGLMILVILAYAVIGIIEIFPLYKHRETGKLIVYSLFFTLAFTVSVLLCSGVNIPSPEGIVEKIVFLITGQKIQ